jgi:hypothetical protein
MMWLNTVWIARAVYVRLKWLEILKAADEVAQLAGINRSGMGEYFQDANYEYKR